MNCYSVLITIAACLFTLCSLSTTAQPIEEDLVVPTPLGFNDTLWFRIPEGYDPLRPPALLLWWHAWGGTHREMVDYTQFDDMANARGWIAAGFNGTHARHWNTDSSQYLCKFTLDYIRERYPFSMDSIYMVGSSMGSAAGQVWHNNNCGKDDYIIAATAGGSQILDCELRQWQYFQLNPTDTNRSMRSQFGGDPYTSDSVRFNYHRASAAHFAGENYDSLAWDTLSSMHFNSLLLPVYNTWGANDEERFAYGNPAFNLWAGLRAGWAPTFIVESDLAEHGLWCMYPGLIIPWLAQFSSKRDPDTLTISADSDTNWYYWTKPVRDGAYVFARYGINRDRERDSLDLRLIRHVQALTIDVQSLELQSHDTLYIAARNYDPAIVEPRLILSHINGAFTTVESVNSETGPVMWERLPDDNSAIQFSLSRDTSYIVILIELAAQSENPQLPVAIRISNAYPNPFNSTLSIQIESDITSSTALELVNIQGQVAKTVPLQLYPGNRTIIVAADHLATGIYFIAVRGVHMKPVKVVLLK